MPKIKIDELEYNTENLSDEGLVQLKSLQFVEGQLLQLRNEIAVYQTAQRAYVSALSAEIEKHGVLPVSIKYSSDQ